MKFTPRQILPGRWRCRACKRTFHLAYSPGVLIDVPTEASNPCACGGEIVPDNDRAHETLAQIKENARERAAWDALAGPNDEEIERVGGAG